MGLYTGHGLAYLPLSNLVKALFMPGREEVFCRRSSRWILNTQCLLHKPIYHHRHHSNASLRPRTTKYTRSRTSLHRRTNNYNTKLRTIHRYRTHLPTTKHYKHTNTNRLLQQRQRIYQPRQQLPSLLPRRNLRRQPKHKTRKYLRKYFPHNNYHKRHNRLCHKYCPIHSHHPRRHIHNYFYLHSSLRPRHRRRNYTNLHTKPRRPRTSPKNGGNVDVMLHPRRLLYARNCSNRNCDRTFIRRVGSIIRRLQRIPKAGVRLAFSASALYSYYPGGLNASLYSARRGIGQCSHGAIRCFKLRRGRCSCRTLVQRVSTGTAPRVLTSVYQSYY